MILMTMIARVADALPLAASIQEDEQVSLKYCFFIGKEFLKILTFHQIFILTVGQKHRWLSKSGKTSLQNLNGYQSYQMFYRVRTLFIPVSFVFTLRIYENLINHCLCLIYSYIIEQDACFLTLCDRNFNKKLAYSFLEDLSQEFYSQYGHRINTATRPYSFIEFGETKKKIIFIVINRQKC